MLPSVRVRRAAVAFAALVGATAGLVGNAFPELREPALGLAFLAGIAVSLYVSRPAGMGDTTRSPRGAAS
jgi:hypothetical protein